VLQNIFYEESQQLFSDPQQQVQHINDNSIEIDHAEERFKSLTKFQPFLHIFV